MNWQLERPNQFTDEMSLGHTGLWDMDIAVPFNEACRQRPLAMLRTCALRLVGLIMFVFQGTSAKDFKLLVTERLFCVGLGLTC